MAKSGKESCRSAMDSEDFWEMEVAIRDQLPEEGSWVVVDYSMPYSIKTASTEWWERTTLWPCPPSLGFRHADFIFTTFPFHRSYMFGFDLDQVKGLPMVSARCNPPTHTLSPCGGNPPAALAS